MLYNPPINIQNRTNIFCNPKKTKQFCIEVELEDYFLKRILNFIVSIKLKIIKQNKKI